MQSLFSAQFKYSTWRRLWVALAKAEKKIGLPITDKQIHSLESKVNDIDFALAHKYEKELQHDVMAHIHAYGDQCPEANGILHMGATSTYVTDNTDLIQMQKGLTLLKDKLEKLIALMKEKALSTADIPTLSYTHLQPAQPTTVGKRICLWIQDLLFDQEDLINRLENLYFLGLKGATGTQASFLMLTDKVDELEEHIANEMGFHKIIPISGQTYTRKQDMRILSVLEGLGASAHKCATDLRLLAHMGEMQEAFGSTQVGSSAMPHKRNPIYAERVCALSRFLIHTSANGADTLATQWLERSLDDSANRRLVLPEAFLCADAILSLLINIFTHLQINEETIAQNLKEKLPELSLENILMLAVKKGKDRQKIHEKLRKAKDIEAIKKDPEIGLKPQEFEECLKPNTGRAKSQVYACLKRSD